jgi:hypothetical protein
LLQRLLSRFCLWRQRRLTVRAEAHFDHAEALRDRATVWAHNDSLVRGIETADDYTRSVALAKASIKRRRINHAKRLARRLVHTMP